jgi:hypothetical protein
LRKLFFQKKVFLYGEKENFEEYSLFLESAELSFAILINYSAKKWRTCPRTTVSHKLPPMLMSKGKSTNLYGSISFFLVFWHKWTTSLLLCKIYGSISETTVTTVRRSLLVYLSICLFETNRKLDMECMWY